MLFSRLGINYNNEDPVFRKGTTVFYRGSEEEGGDASIADTQRTINQTVASQSALDLQKTGKAAKAKRKKRELIDEAIDIIGDDFWTANSYLLER